jgi:hypothetical protein
MQLRDVLYGTDLGHNRYNGLQVKMDRRFSHGLQALVSYTWAKSMDNGTDGFYTGDPQNLYNLAAEHGVSNSDRKHILTISGIYELPLGKGKRWLNRGHNLLPGNWSHREHSIGDTVTFGYSDSPNVGNSVKTHIPNVVET